MRTLRKTIAIMIATIMTFCPLLALSAETRDAELDVALNVEGGTLIFGNNPDHPMAVDTTQEGRVCAVTTNQGISSSTSSVTLDAGSLEAGAVVAFDVRVSCEPNYDKFTLEVNGVVDATYTLSGARNWSTYRYVAPSSGEYTFEFKYTKDTSVDREADTMWLDNISVTPPIAVTGITVEPAEATVYIGTSCQLVANILPEGASNQMVEWTSSNPDVAEVDAEGNVTALAEGTCTITATTEDGGFTDTCQVSVPAPVQPTGITTDFDSAILVAGKQGTVIATVLPENAYDKTVTWVSSDTSICTVNENGRITAVVGAVGECTITATTVNGISTEIAISVMMDASCPGVEEFSYSEIEVDTEYSGTLGFGYSSPIYFLRSSPTTTYYTTTHAIGYSVELVAGTTYDFTSYSPDGTRFDTCINVYDSEFNFVEYDDDSSGNLYGEVSDYTATQSGTYYIIVSAHGYTSTGNYNFMVYQHEPVPVEGVEFTAESVTVGIGGTVAPAYSVLPADADNQLVLWSSADESIARVADGIITGVSTGTTTITVTTVEGGYSDTIEVNVTTEVIVWSEDFDDYTGWTRPDTSSDTNWYFSSGRNAHGGEGGYAASDSFAEDYTVYPNNWLVSPAITLPSDCSTLTLNYYVACNGYAGEHYTLYVSTTGNSVSDFTTSLQSETINNLDYEIRTVDLSAYAGETIYLAWRHHDCADIMSLRLDTITLIASGFESLLGDVNGDGSISGDDALSIMRHVLGVESLNETSLASADYNEDGNVDLADALAVLRYSLTA